MRTNKLIDQFEVAVRLSCNTHCSKSFVTERHVAKCKALLKQEIARTRMPSWLMQVVREQGRKGGK